MAYETLYRGFRVRHSKDRDTDGFFRYNAELFINGEWEMVSVEALDDETIYQELDTRINEEMACSEK